MSANLKHAAYQQGINWIAENEKGFDLGYGPTPLTLSLFSFLYGVDIDKIRVDVGKAVQSKSDRLDKELEEDGDMMVPLADKIG